MSGGVTMRLLEGKCAAITGGARGIGRDVALRFAEHGARVAVLDVDAAGAQAVAREVGGSAHVCDVADSAAVERALGEVYAKLGALDVLVNNAGASHLASLEATGDADWRRMLDVNLSGVFFATRAAAPLMRRGAGGVIVNNASGSGPRPTRGESAYSAAKAGVIALTQAAAQEYGPEIRVNCVSPGLIRTPMSEALFTRPATLDPMRLSTPLGRAGTGDEVADVVVFLASDLSRYVTGQNLVVDGGMGLAQAGIDQVLKDLLRWIESKKK
jgi:NAD(P)-dependent dehydrogenase (short-subunit alcohol dehydrogenase family)